MRQNSLKVYFRLLFCQVPLLFCVSKTMLCLMLLSFRCAPWFLSNTILCRILLLHGLPKGNSFWSEDLSKLLTFFPIYPCSVKSLRPVILVQFLEIESLAFIYEVRIKTIGYIFNLGIELDDWFGKNCEILMRVASWQPYILRAC